MWSCKTVFCKIVSSLKCFHFVPYQYNFSVKYVEKEAHLLDNWGDLQCFFSDIQLHLDHPYFLPVKAKVHICC